VDLVVIVKSIAWVVSVSKVVLMIIPTVVTPVVALDSNIVPQDFTTSVVRMSIGVSLTTCHLAGMGVLAHVKSTIASKGTPTNPVVAIVGVVVYMIVTDYVRHVAEIAMM